MKSSTPGIIQGSLKREAVYAALMNVVGRIGRFEVEEKKTCLHLNCDGKAFLGVHPRKLGLRLTLISNREIEDPRILKTERVSKNRVHHDIELRSVADLDEKVVEWIKESFAIRRRTVHPVNAAPEESRKPSTVDEYIAQIPSEEARASLSRLRSIILSEVPKAKEVISYGIPTYKLNKKMLSIAAFKNHCSFFPGYTVREFADKLKGYKTSTGTIQFSPDHPLPESLVREIVRARFWPNTE